MASLRYRSVRREDWMMILESPQDSIRRDSRLVIQCHTKCVP